MGLMLKNQRDGSLRKDWYGVYTEANGKRTVLNLNLKWDGIPPASGRVGDKGDADFEESRKTARKALAKHAEEARRKGRADHLTERLIESKTGRQVEYVRIGEMSDRWRQLGREHTPTERYLKACDAHFTRFKNYMAKEHGDAVYLYEITPKDAAGFAAACRKKLAPATTRYALRLMNKSLVRFLPVGSENPFTNFVGRRGNGESGVVHRKPFSNEELRLLLDAARCDEFMYPLIVTAACTGMRRGDVCTMRWEDIDLKEGMLAAKTSKTEAAVEIPIFKPLRAVLKVLGDKKKGFVFPDAAQMLNRNPNGLTWRFKKIVALAFQKQEEEKNKKKLKPLPPPPEPVDPAKVEEKALKAIRANIAEGSRQDRMLDVMRLYSAGMSLKKIAAKRGNSTSTISTDLHTIVGLVGEPFMRVHSNGINKVIREVTRVERAKGQRAGSIRDWHALRATYVTLALSAGVPVELVRRVTGHATVEIVLKHYFRPDRDDFKDRLLSAMPEILTGKKHKPKPAEELAALTAKLARGKATKDDKARIKDLAAKL